MNPKEVKSLCSQLAYTYSTNRLANFPFSLTFSSLDGRTCERMDSIGDASHRRWSKTEWWTEGLERLWSDSPAAVSSSEIASGTALAGEGPGPSSGTAAKFPFEGLPSSEDIRQKVVYLTADCDEELTELKPDEIYVIGGIVDHNRYKNLCLNKAKELGVRTAKLPIGSYLSHLPTRKVLTVNQCFEILVKWVETKSWEEALYSVIPKRKFQTGEKGKETTLVAAELVEGGEEEEVEKALPDDIMVGTDKTDDTEGKPPVESVQNEDP
ncbi:guanine-1-methyltransferase-domain-containing protein [Coprinopsis sp. MPI-PUGE-AT-0042]|nr:guanine-1-methyltransferase-domain-containing protein [Coprinopsis sp. MPI-PUGE-AT-0042]